VINISNISALVRRLWAITIIRFLVVGGINTVFGYFVFALFILLKLNYVSANLIAYSCSILFNFKMHGMISFGVKSNWLIFRFVGVSLFIYLINIGLLKIFKINDVNVLVAQAVLVFPLAFISFLLNSKFVFKRVSREHR